MRVHSHHVDYTASPSADEQQKATTNSAGPGEKVSAVYQAMLAVYGRPTWRAHHPPMDELVLTILSQHTSDLNSGRAFDSLRQRFATWAHVRDAPVAAVAEAIKSGGL